MLIRAAAFAAIVTPVWAICLMSASVTTAATTQDGEAAVQAEAADIPAASAVAWTALAGVTCFTRPVCRTVVARRAARPRRGRRPRTLRGQIETACGVRRVARCPVLDAKRMTG